MRVEVVKNPLTHVHDPFLLLKQGSPCPTACVSPEGEGTQLRRRIYHPCVLAEEAAGSAHLPPNRCRDGEWDLPVCPVPHSPTRARGKCKNSSDPTQLLPQHRETPHDDAEYSSKIICRRLVLQTSLPAGIPFHLADERLCQTVPMRRGCQVEVDSQCLKLLHAVTQRTRLGLHRNIRLSTALDKRLPPVTHFTLCRPTNQKIINPGIA
eukprot:TRINITY_DN2977_c0_g1_i1.p2 TRINITY_DN2977_c0_g1~~TRINITY_DN2977_c0_g1_i1.p2  ORF type:complete len:209 (+),score=2.66 TRINITY_DN2977_c0_g1_i1:407-1033(+)